MKKLFKLYKLRFLVELRDPAAFFFAFVFPIFLILILGSIFATGGNDVKFDVAFVDVNDDVNSSLKFVPVFKDKSDDFESLEDAKKGLEDNKIQFILTSEDEKLKVTYLPAFDSDYNQIVKPILENVSFVSKISQLSEGEEFSGSFEVVGELSDGKNVNFQTVQLMGYLLQSIFIYSLIAIPTVFGQYKQAKVLKRFFLLPVKKWQILLSHIMVSTTISILQMSVLVALVIVMFDIKIVNVPLTVLTLVLSSLGFVGIGLSIAAVTKNIQTANALSNAIAFPFVVIGGGWFPKVLLPDFLTQLNVINPFGASLDLINAFAANSEFELPMQSVITIGVIFVVTWSFGMWKFSLKK